MLQRGSEEPEAPRLDKPVAPSALMSAAEVTLEQEREAIRRGRLGLKREEERIKDLGFRRRCLVVVLAICGLVAVGSTAVVAAGVFRDASSLLVPALLPLSGAGALGVAAWRIYVDSMLLQESSTEEDQTAEKFPHHLGLAKR